MINSRTKETLVVSTAGDAGPYIIVVMEQLDKVKSLLDEGAFKYWIDETAISVDGEPATTVINFNSGTDPNAVQNVLDNAS